MIELICLACSQSNPADAKFCSQCGAALLRRFCEQCHAVNGAESHFCHSCGAVLSKQLLPPTLAPMPDAWREDARVHDGPGDVIPTLDQVVVTDEAEVAMTAPTLQPLQGPPPGLVDETPSGGSALQAMKPAHRTALLAVGGLLVLLVAAALWSRAPPTEVRPANAGTAATRGAAPADVPAPAVPTAEASTTTGSSEPVEGSAPATSGASKAGESSAEALAVPSDAPRPSTPPPSIATEPRRPAVTNRSPRGTATPAPAASPTNAASPTPAPECTRQLDTLGLCAPGATITGR